LVVFRFSNRYNVFAGGKSTPNFASQYVKRYVSCNIRDRKLSNNWSFNTKGGPMKKRFSLVLALAMLLLVAAPVAAQPDFKGMTTTIVGVDRNDSVYVRLENFPSDETFYVMMNRNGTLGIGGYLSSKITTNSGGTFYAKFPFRRNSPMRISSISASRMLRDRTTRLTTFSIMMIPISTSIPASTGTVMIPPTTTWKMVSRPSRSRQWMPAPRSLW